MQYKYVIGYLRLSQDDEDKNYESNSIKNQRLLIQQFINGNEEFQGAKTVFFSDDGYSGTNFNRPDFKKMMELVKAESSCCVIVKDLSRLGRDTIDTQQYIEKIFPFLLVRFIAINDYYDSSAPLASRKDTEAKFKNLVNGIYPQICSKNIKQVMRKQAEAGKYHGSVPPYGYMFKNEDKTVLHLDREVSGNVRFIFDKRLEGEKYSEIAKMMNEKGIETPTAYLLKKGYSLYNTQCLPVWNSHMVRKILLNPIYAGIMTNHKSEKKDLSTKSCVRLPRKDWSYVPGTHEAIVTADELDKVMGMVETGAAYHGPQKIPKNIFRYKLKCGYCGRALRVRSENKTPAMGCSTSKVSQNTKCYAGQYKTAEFEKLFLKLVQREAALAEDTLKQIKQVSKTQNLSKLKSRKKGCEEKVQKVKQQKMEFYEAFVDGKVTKEGYLRKKELLTQKEHRYKELITELQEQIIQAEEKRKLAKSPELLAFSKCKDLTELSYEVIQELVEVIYFYDPEHIEVIWKYRDEFLEAEKALAE